MLTAPSKGPLLAVKHWDLSLIKICSMHALNLGLVYTANGGVLTPVEIKLRMLADQVCLVLNWL